MARYLLDTNHAGTLLDERAPLWAKLQPLSKDRVVLCRPSVGELWFMVFNSSRAESNRAKLLALLRQFKVREFDDRAAEEFGAIRAELRRSGRNIPPIDVQIAAIARRQGFTLLTADAHFRQVPDLTVENWLGG
jgi:tRNA(fMet)-specific endonuclease VapC